MLCFKKRSCCLTLPELRYLRSFMGEHFLLRLSRIMSNWFLFVWSRKNSLPFKLLPITDEKNLTTRTIMFTLLIYNVPHAYWRNNLAYSICHKEDIYRLLERLTSKACNFTKINTPPWVFFAFLKLCKWYQIAQRTTYF